jgi:hypothetical protein
MSFANRFGWSISRDATFNTCKRRYYFHYYLSWGGWESGAPLLAREAFRLKRLVSFPLWRGQLVHYIAAKVLQSMRAKGRIPDKDKVIGYCLERFEAQFEFSRSGKYRTTPKKTGDKLNIDWLALLDHEYGRSVAPAVLERIREECIQGIEGLYEGPILGEVMGTDHSRWVIEDIDSGSFSQQFPFNGVTVFVKTDFLYRGVDGTLRIVDWKTNRGGESFAGAEEEEPKDASVQLGVYGYYAARILREPVSSIRLYEVNLLRQGRIIEHAADEQRIARAEDTITKGITELRSVLVGEDIGRNEALPAPRFPRIENGRCGYCNFFRICKDESNPHALP